jgi:hypothetical protein
MNRLSLMLIPCAVAGAFTTTGCHDVPRNPPPPAAHAAPVAQPRNGGAIRHKPVQPAKPQPAKVVNRQPQQPKAINRQPNGMRPAENNMRPTANKPNGNNVKKGAKVKDANNGTNRSQKRPADREAPARRPTNT